MNKLYAGFRSVMTPLVIAAILSSCYSSQQLVQPSLSQRVSNDPSFLDGLSVAGGNKTIGIQLSPKDVCLDDIKIDPSKSNTLQSRFASLLNVVPQAITNISLYSFLNEWYGTRYRLGGTDKGGIDCSAFMQKIYERVFGISLVRTAIEQFHNASFISEIERLKEGDLVFFHIKGSRVSHVGMYLMNRCFVHASSSHGVMISSLDDKYWQRYYAGAGRLL